MGACFQTLIVPSVSKLAVEVDFEAAQIQDRHDNGHSYSGGLGMAEGLEFKNETFETYQEAEAWLADNSQKWEAALAVKFKDKNGKTKTLIGAWCSS
jgi:hypothetical protein